ncbi:hypothetical protein [Porphyromonas pogonae]|uniref:hypothetical protein n=1 Tax=Porphyromonas pogonae TaxID=867595 RepID=UPI002E7A0B96|nr:hypothetical protein [Porphyromonas pogonae]
MTKRESRKQRSNWPAMQRSHPVLSYIFSSLVLLCKVSSSVSAHSMSVLARYPYQELSTVLPELLITLDKVSTTCA